MRDKCGLTIRNLTVRTDGSGNYGWHLIRRGPLKPVVHEVCLELYAMRCCLYGIIKACTKGSTSCMVDHSGKYIVQCEHLVANT